MSEQNEQNKNPNPGEQGRAEHSTGSTTQGGSNFGQGSSHLGGESYQQGNVSNKGANYDNETDKIGSSTTGTNAEGSSSPGAGGGMTEQTGKTVDKNTGDGAQNVSNNWKSDEERNDTRQDGLENKDTKKLFEGDRRDTSLEQSSGLEENKDESSKSAGESRGWSSSTTNDADGPQNK